MNCRRKNLINSDISQNRRMRKAVFKTAATAVKLGVIVFAAYTAMTGSIFVADMHDETGNTSKPCIGETVNLTDNEFDSKTPQASLSEAAYYENAVAEEEVFREDNVEAVAGWNEIESADSFINPTCGVLTSGFGSRWGRQHCGIDIGGDRGEGIYAVQDGTVIFADTVSGYGMYIKIEHDGGFETSYGHCDTLLVSCGQTVTQGQLIAYMGSTGNSTGPHLHFEVKLNGDYVNPLEYVRY